MLKKFYRYAALMLAVVTFGCLASCNDDDPVAAPSIDIKNTEPGETDISFRLIPHDATSYGYAVVTSADYKAKNYQFTMVNNGQEESYTVSNLTSGETYYIVAIAYNGTIASEEKSVRTRTGSLIDLPTVEVKDFTMTEDSVTCMLVASPGTSYLQFTFYPEVAAGGEHVWQKLLAVTDNEAEKLNPEGNWVGTTGLMPGDYVLEAIPYVHELEGERLLYKFKLEITNRTYVSMNSSDLTFKDMQVTLKKNPLCHSYYIGLVKESNFKPANVLDMLAKGGAEAVHETADYSGSLRELLGKDQMGAWFPRETVTLWIVPCDENGEYSQDPAYVIKHHIEIPKRTYTFNGSGKVEVDVTATENTSYTAKLKATDCAHYYLLTGAKAEIEAALPSQDLVLDSMMKLNPQTEMERTIGPSNLQPDTDYRIYAIAADSEGELGKLTTVDVHTPALDFSSSASIAVATKQINYEDVVLTFTPANGCTRVRYLLLTPAEYVQTPYNGIASRVQSALALNTESKIVTLDLTGATDVPIRLLTSNQQYLLFVLPLDADGKMGSMPEELTFRPKKFDLTGTATVTYTKPRITGQSPKRVRFTVTPEAGCKGYYVQAISEGNSYTDNELISKLLKPESTYVYDEDGGDAPEYDFDLTIYNNATIYILCRDAEGKFNNPRENPTPIKVEF